jgi:uncharacterized protein (TIGR03067 family)
MASLLSRTAACLLLPCLLQGQSFAPKLAPAAPVDLQRLQGTWVGGTLVQDGPTGALVKSPEKITISIQGDSFHFHRDTNFWFSTTIELPKGKIPQQLRATIRTNAPSQGTNAIGKVVVSLVKVEGETLTLASKGDGDDNVPTGFEGENVMLYELQKVQEKPARSVPPGSKHLGNLH